MTGMIPGSGTNVARPAANGVERANESISSRAPAGAPSGAQQAELREAFSAELSKATAPPTTSSPAPTPATGATAPTTASVAAGARGPLKFSAHAVERMHSRGVSFGAEELSRIESALTKAATKGSKDTLVLSGERGLIVNIKNNTVVTVMDRAALRENVFTNIDSTVVV